MILRFLCLFLLICSACHRSGVSPIDEASAIKSDNFFPIPFIGYNAAHIPGIEVRIEHRSYALLFDLGSTADLSLPESLASEIQDKEFFSSAEYCSARGRRYGANLYRLERALIGGMPIRGVMLCSHPQQLQEDGSFSKDLKKSAGDGGIGWRLFEKTQLFIDAPNDRLVLLRGIEALSQNGYPIEEFVCTPLLLDRGLVECMVEISGIAMRCTLDSGSTSNFCAAPKGIQQSIESVLNDPKAKTVKSLAIAEVDMGEIEMISHTFDLPVQIEAVLGMQFIRDHQIVIDFPAKKLYFRRSLG